MSPLAGAAQMTLNAVTTGQKVILWTQIVTTLSTPGNRVSIQIWERENKAFIDHNMCKIYLQGS